MDRETESIEQVLRSLDHKVPAISAESIAAKARARSRGRSRWLAILTVGVAGAAYAAPGSPLRAWLGAIVERAPATPKTTIPAAVPSAAPAPSGIAIDPGARLVIVFEFPRVGGAAGGAAIVSLEDGTEAVVRAPHGAATFTTGTERLAIGEWDSSARFEIVVPRSAPRVEIRVGTRRVFLKAGRSVTTAGRETGPGRYTIPLDLLARHVDRRR